MTCTCLLPRCKVLVCKLIGKKLLIAENEKTILSVRLWQKLVSWLSFVVDVLSDRVCEDLF